MDDLALLEKTRSQLLRDLDRVHAAAANWVPVPGARTIAESLLHVAAVEFVFAAALALRARRDVPVELWDGLKAGLATEVGYDPPQDVGIPECIERLEQVRLITRSVVHGDQARLTDDEVRAALERLRENGGDLAHDRIDALVPKLASHVGVGSVGIVLTAHEEYHRGQVLYQNFLATRLPSAA
jgi:hypothetical protein